MIPFKVRYIGQDYVLVRHGKTYDVISIERGFYKIMAEDGEYYLFPPECFEKED